LTTFKLLADVRFGSKQTLPHVRAMSALPPKADIPGDELESSDLCAMLSL
jgi:hypothetical protein